MSPPLGTSPSVTELESRISAVGTRLRTSVLQVLDALGVSGQGPQGIAKELGLDKVLMSRLLKATRSLDPIAVAHHAPGPEPLRRFYRAARRRGAGSDLIATGEQVVNDFHMLIREEFGDRSTLDAMLSSWLPQARQEFELRRKQSAFKAMSQLKGVSARLEFGTVLLHPASDGDRIDIVWIVGMFGIQRCRPGAQIKLATRRQTAREGHREPTTLDGRSVSDLDGLRLDRFCHDSPAELQVKQVGETVHYLLAGEGVGKKSVFDLLFAEVNLAEIPRHPAPGRRGYVFAEVSTPSQRLLFDVLVHEDVYRGVTPELLIYDTAFDGVVDVNDPAREIDRLDIVETLQQLGSGLQQLRAPDVPQHLELLRHVFDSMQWNPDDFRSYRSAIDYPLYGSQVVVAFDPN